ncbi:D-lactate ferricytochrome c oxidoreductase [Aspergillus hancockii]|nr:D-lactate ferricytochrome c oxidoreductase [Aspergillus hancockii]
MRAGSRLESRSIQTFTATEKEYWYLHYHQLLRTHSLWSRWILHRNAKRPGPALTSTTLLEEFPQPYHDTSPSNVQSAIEEFVEILGKDNAITDKEALAPYSTSEWSSYSTKDTKISSVAVCPSTTEEVSRIMKVWYRRRLPVTAYAGGTSLEGHFAPTRGGVSIDFQSMDEILSVLRDDLDVVVQPAVQWEMLNEELAKDGLFFPPDPGPGPMIGGMVGTGCSGSNAYHYGTMREWVLSLMVVPAEMTIVKTRQRPRKSSAGYDLTRMFIGSEGTLGLVTEATLKPAVKPLNEAVAVASFLSMRDAASCVSESTSRSWDETPTLFFKSSGAPDEVKEKIAIVRQLADYAHRKTFTFARSSVEVDELWSARKVALWSILQMKEQPTDHVWTADVAVPMSRRPDIIEQTREEINDSGLFGGMVGHAGDGNFHAMLLFNDGQREVAERIVHNMVKRAVEMEGTVTGEHGVGMVKRDYLEHELGKTAVDTMREVRDLLHSAQHD